MLDTFTAIDFETAHGKRWSICQVGLVRVENNVMTEKLSILVQPPDNFYWNNFINIHGITPRKTAYAHSFDYIWQQIKPFIATQNVVAHNGFGFDFQCLRQTLEFYQIAIPNFVGHCTYKIFKSNLASLCKTHNISLKHHDALSDAMACAELFKIYLAA
jgi:DNA polymerase-3 subunit epsilon